MGYAASLLYIFIKCVTHYDTFTETLCKDVGGLSEGDWGVAKAYRTRSLANSTKRHIVVGDGISLRYRYISI